MQSDNQTDINLSNMFQEDLLDALSKLSEKVSIPELADKNPYSKEAGSIRNAVMNAMSSMLVFRELVSHRKSLHDDVEKFNKSSTYLSIAMLIIALVNIVMVFYK